VTHGNDQIRKAESVSFLVVRPHALASRHECAGRVGEDAPREFIGAGRSRGDRVALEVLVFPLGRLWP
jgi:hypothetical protein